MQEHRCRSWWIALALAAALALAPDTLARPTAAHADPGAASLDQRIAQAWRQLEVVVERYNAIQENLGATRHQIRDLSARLEPMREGIAEERHRLDLLLTGVYKTTTAGTLGALLTDGSPGEVLDQLATLDQVARLRDAQVRELTVTQDRYDQQRRTLDALAAQQDSQRADLAREKAAVEARIASLTRMRATASGAAGPADGTGAPPDAVVPPYSGAPAARAVRFAYQQIGKPYRWGAAGPDGYDCSGLVMAAWLAAGVRLPHNSAMQFSAVAHIPRTALRPGDLVFYFADIHHVAIYVGNGAVIHAPEYGETVRIAKIELGPIYGYGRVR